VNPVDPPQAPDVSTSLVSLPQRAISTRAGQVISVPSASVPSADAFAWSSPARRGEANFIPATVVENSQSDESENSAWEYVSGWAWSRFVGSTAAAIYLSYAAAPTSWSGRLIDLYA
jgi:hypothetical protein